MRQNQPTADRGAPARPARVSCPAPTGGPATRRQPAKRRPGPACMERAGQGSGGTAGGGASARAAQRQEDASGGGPRATRIESQAGTAVPAHRGQRGTAWRKQRQGEGDSCTHGEQGTRPVGRGPDGQPHLHPGHAVSAPWRTALPPGRAGPDVCPAVCRGPQARHTGALIDEQGTACAGSGALMAAVNTASGQDPGAYS